VTTAVSQQYNLGPVQPWVQNAAYGIGPQFGIKTIYGWRKTDPFPDHPTGHALDFMTPNMDVGNALADYATTNYQALGIKYVIWNRRYWDPQTGWVPYTATTNPHTDHVHITFLDQPGAWTATPTSFAGGTTGATLTAAGDATCAWNLSIPFPVVGNKNMCVISKRQARELLGASSFAAGVVVGVIGIVLLMVYGLGQTAAGAILPPAIRRVVS
jgi:hypothetical protein